MDKYEIKIYICGIVKYWYYNINVSEVLNWFRKKWEKLYYDGGCAFVVYKNNVPLSSSELYRLGFIR